MISLTGRTAHLVRWPCAGAPHRRRTALAVSGLENG